MHTLDGDIWVYIFFSTSHLCQCTRKVQVQDCSNSSALAILQSCTKLLKLYITIVIYFYSGLLISDFFVDYPSITSNKSRLIHQATFTQVGFAVHLSCDKVQHDMRDMLSDTDVYNMAGSCCRHLPHISMYQWFIRSVSFKGNCSP